MTEPGLGGVPQVVVVTGAGSGLGQAIAERLALAGHVVYAGMRGIGSRSADRAAAAQRFATVHGVALLPLELDVLSDTGCRAAVDQVLSEQGRLDVVVNNAGMLMSGVAEAFSPEQFLTILDTNAVSWLRMARAVLPVMRRQGAGTLVYVSSTTAHIVEPFMATYIASKAAGEAFAESIGFEVTPFGIDTVIVVPGAFTQGTEHFAHTTGPAEPAVRPSTATLRRWWPRSRSGWLRSTSPSRATPPTSARSVTPWSRSWASPAGRGHGGWSSMPSARASKTSTRSGPSASEPSSPHSASTTCSTSPTGPEQHDQAISDTTTKPSVTPRPSHQ